MQLYAIGIQQSSHKIMQGERDAAGKKLRKANTLAGARSRAYLQASGTGGKLIRRW
jgi:hypothetical protein